MYHEIAGTPVLIAAVPLKECFKLPASRTARCFKKTSGKASDRARRSTRASAGRQAVGVLFLPQRHHGAALCNKMKLDGGILMLRGLSVANSCQSLNVLF
jgi:hypothetical protein